MQLISIYNSLWQGANHDNQQIALTSFNSFLSEGFSDAEKKLGNGRRNSLNSLMH